MRRISMVRFAVETPTIDRVTVHVLVEDSASQLPVVPLDSVPELSVARAS